MAKRVSLYIEDTEIKLLVTNGNQVEKWGSLLLDPGLVNEGVILDENRVAESVKQLFKLQNVAETTVTAGISGLNSVFRVISIPEVPKKLLQEAIGNEASRILPMPLSQVYYSYQSLPSPKGEMRLFLAAYPRVATDVLLNVIKKAGLKVELMDLAPLALARCVNAERAIVVHSWLTFVDIIVLSDRIPLVIRSLSLPVESASLHERLPAIIEELNRTITFYNSTYSDKSLDKMIPVFVSGDIAGDKESMEQLGKLGHPVSALKPPLTYKDVFNPSRYMVNAGLALKGHVSAGAGNWHSTIDFNALPPAYLPEGFNWSHVLLPVGAVVAIGALAYGAATVHTLKDENKILSLQGSTVQTQINGLISDNKKTQDSITAKKAESATLSSQSSDLQAQVSSTQQNAGLFNTSIDSLKSNLSKTDLNLREAVNDIPKGLNLTNIQYQSDGVNLTGVSPTQALILTYARSLRTGGRFVSVTVSSVETLSDGTFGFTIILR